MVSPAHMSAEPWFFSVGGGRSVILNMRLMAFKVTCLVFLFTCFPPQSKNRLRLFIGVSELHLGGNLFRVYPTLTMTPKGIQQRHHTDG